MNNNIFKPVIVVFSMSITGTSYADKSYYRSPEYVEGAITTSLLEV